MSDPRIETRTDEQREALAATDREFSSALDALSAEVRERFWHDEQRRFLLGR
jgi:hypothetical protein